ENVSVVIPALSVQPDEKGYKMEYFVRAVDRWEGTLAEAGSSRQPNKFSVAPASLDEGIASKWWFWTVLAGVAAAGVGLLYVATHGSSDNISLVIKDKGVGGS